MNNKVLQLELSKLTVIRKLSFTQGTIVNAMRSSILFAMLYLIFLGQISLGEFLTLWFYSFYIFAPLGDIGTVAAQYQQAKGSLEKLEEILNIPSEEKPVNPVVIKSLESIEFKNVSFGYGEGNVLAVRDMNLSVKGGEVVAFAGYSGSGKTTLVKLLVGLYRPTKGEILLNGIGGGNVDYDALRRRIGYVSQETQLTDTIKEIAKSRPNLITVMVAHRLSTISHADRIYVLQKGGVIEQGTHAKLLENRDGLYTALWKEQSGSGD